MVVLAIDSENEGLIAIVRCSGAEELGGCDGCR